MEKPDQKQGKEMHDANTLRYASRAGGHQKAISPNKQKGSRVRDQPSDPSAWGGGARASSLNIGRGSEMPWWWLGATMTSWSLSQGAWGCASFLPDPLFGATVECCQWSKKKTRQDPAGEATLNSKRGGSRSRIRPIRARLNKPCGNPRRHVDATDRTRPGDDAPKPGTPTALSGHIWHCCPVRSALCISSGSGMGIHH